MTDYVLSADDRRALDRLAADLRRNLQERVFSIVAYGTDRPLHTLVLVDRLAFDDLAACAPLLRTWRRSGLATPLMLSRHEFLRTLDVFPIEYGAILEEHAVVVGPDPFAGCSVSEVDLRRAVELQAKSHLIHLREGFLEADGRSEAIARLMQDSAPAYRLLLHNLDRLSPDGNDRARSRQLLDELASGSSIADPTPLFARYVADVERIWQLVDTWR